MNKVWKVILISSLCLLILGFALLTTSILSGGSLERISSNIGITERVDEFGTEDVQSLDIRVGAGRLNIVQGDSFRVEAKNIAAEFYACRVDNGVLVIEENWPESWSLNLSRWLRLSQYEPQVTVFVPSAFAAESAAISVSAGSCHVDGLSAYRTELRVSAGELTIVDARTDSIAVDISAGLCRIDNLITEHAEFDVAAGEFFISGLQAGSCRLEVSAGIAFIGGGIGGTGEFYCGVGSITLELDGARSDYDIDVSVDLGSISIDGDSYGGNVSRSFSGGDGAASLDLSCNIGEINLSFMGK